MCVSARMHTHAQLCPTLCNPMDCRPTRLLCPWDSPSQNTGVGSCSLLQGIFQKSNRGLWQGRRILYQLSYQESPINLLPLTFQGPQRATCFIQSVWVYSCYLKGEGGWGRLPPSTGTGTSLRPSFRGPCQIWMKHLH